jgi:hypothetical protein
VKLIDFQENICDAKFKFNFGSLFAMKFGELQRFCLDLLEVWQISNPNLQIH